MAWTVGKEKMMVVCRASPSSIMIQWTPLFPVFHNPGLFFKKEDFFPIWTDEEEDEEAFILVQRRRSVFFIQVWSDEFSLVFISYFVFYFICFIFYFKLVGWLKYRVQIEEYGVGLEEASDGGSNSRAR